MALARWQTTIVDDAGNVQDGASIEVRREDPGAPLASLYSDREGAVPVGNPFVTGPDGFAAFHAAGGAYRITATKGGFSREWRYVAIGLAGETDGGDGGVAGPGATVTAGQLAVFSDTSGAAIEGATAGGSPPSPVTADDVIAALTAPQGKQSIWMPAGAMNPRAGTTAGQMDIAGANGSRVGYLVCPPSGISGGSFQIAMPKGWNEGPLTARVFWKHPAAATNFATVWEVSALSLGNGDSMTSGTFGGVSVTDVGGSTDTLYVSDETAAINPGNTEVELDYLAFHAFRLGDAGGDTLAVEAHLLGVMIYYTTNANTDD